MKLRLILGIHVSQKYQCLSDFVPQKTQPDGPTARWPGGHDHPTSLAESATSIGIAAVDQLRSC